MTPELFALYIGVPVQDTQMLLSLDQDAIYGAPLYLQIIQTLNLKLLDSTLAEVRQHLNDHLPRLIAYLQTNHPHVGGVMTPYTLGNWTIGYLHHPQELQRIVSLHNRVSISFIAEGLPHILDIFDRLQDPAASSEWKKALSILALPLLCDR